MLENPDTSSGVLGGKRVGGPSVEVPDELLSARSQELRVFESMKDIFVYRKGLSDNIVKEEKEKDSQCELVRRKGRSVLAIGDKDKGGSSLSEIQTSYRSSSSGSESESDSSSSYLDSSSRKISRSRSRSCLIGVAVRADPGPAARTPPVPIPVPVHALVQSPRSHSTARRWYSMSVYITASQGSRVQF